MNTKKLKAWDSSKLDLDADYDSKTMQDWIAILQGKKVPDAEPNNKAYAEAVRHGFKKLYPDRKSKLSETDALRFVEEMQDWLKKEGKDE